MPAGQLQVGPEVATTLGRLKVDKPHIADRVMEVPEYAKVVRWVLNAIDGYQDRSGEGLDTLRRHIHAGRIEIRCVGGRITVVTPG